MTRHRNETLAIWLPRVTVDSTLGLNRSPLNSTSPSRFPSERSAQLSRIESKSPANWVTSKRLKRLVRFSLDRLMDIPMVSLVPWIFCLVTR
jgi:hypothetical protein